LLKWFLPIKLFIFERKPRNRVSGVRFQVSVVRKSWKAINKLVMHPIISVLVELFTQEDGYSLSSHF